MEFIFDFIFGFIVMIFNFIVFTVGEMILSATSDSSTFLAVSISQKKAVGKVEKNKLVPILDRLFINPKTQENHQEFMQYLSLLDKKIRHYKSDQYSYTPGDLLIKTLLIHLDKYPQDKLAHERFMGVISRAEQVSSEYLFKRLLEQMKQQSNALSDERFAACVTKARFLSSELLDPLFDYLVAAPLNPVVQQHFLHCAMQIILLPDIQRQRIYDVVLKILENSPTSSTAKQFVLNVGRWHFSNLRQDGRLTIYDEQRIENDILIRIT